MASVVKRSKFSSSHRLALGVGLAMTAYLFSLFCVSNLGARYQVLGSLFWLLVLPAIMASMLVKLAVLRHSKRDVVLHQLRPLWVFGMMYITVYALFPVKPKAYFVNANPDVVLSLYDSYFVYILSSLGLGALLISIGDEVMWRSGRKIVGAILGLIGILSPGLAGSYSSLAACSNSKECYLLKNADINLDTSVIFTELTISCAVALGMTFMFSFMIPTLAPGVQKLLGHSDVAIEGVGSLDLPAASGDKDLPAETASESMSPANVQELVASPKKQPAAGKTSTSQCLTAAAVLSVVAVVGASFGRWTVRRH